MSMAAILIGGAAVGGAVSAVGTHNAGKDAAGAAYGASKQMRADSQKAAKSLEKYKKLFSNPRLILLDAIKGSLANLPEAQKLAIATNKGNQLELERMLSQALPGYKGGVRDAMKNTLSWIRGQVPDDVAAQIRNRTAQQALRGGFANSASSRALTARDLGRTSLDLMAQGENSMQRWLGVARESLMPRPFDPAAFFTSPELAFRSVESAAGVAEKQASIILGGANAATQTQLEGRKAEIAAQQQMYQTIGSTVSSLGGAYAGMGGFGGGGAPGGYQNYLNASGAQLYSYDPSASDSYIPVAKPTGRRF